MNRRRVLSFVILAVCAAVILWPSDASHRFVFKIKTKTGEIVVNIVIEAKDEEAAKHKLRQRFPDGEILEMEEK